MTAKRSRLCSGPNRFLPLLQPLQVVGSALRMRAAVKTARLSFFSTSSQDAS